MSELVSPASIASWPEPGAELPASIVNSYAFENRCRSEHRGYPMRYCQLYGLFVGKTIIPEEYQNSVFCLHII
jgi:hypothetical protein